MISCVHDAVSFPNSIQGFVAKKKSDQQSNEPTHFTCVFKTMSWLAAFVFLLWFGNVQTQAMTKNIEIAAGCALMRPPRARGLTW